MTIRRIIVDQEDFKFGKLAYYTKCYITYRVKFVKKVNESILVEVVDLICIHEKALKESGLRRLVVPTKVGSQLKVLPEKLWSIETIKEPSLFVRLRDWFQRKTS